MNSVLSHLRLVGSCGCLLSILLAASAQAGQFDKIRSEVRQPDAEKTTKNEESKNYHDHCHDDDDHDDNGFGTMIGIVIGDLISGMFTGSMSPGTFAERDYYDGSTAHLQPYSDSSGLDRLPPTEFYPVERTSRPVFERTVFAEFPYADGMDGYLLKWDQIGATPHQHSGGRIQFEYGSDFDSIDRWSASVLREGPLGFGIDSQWDYYTEQLPLGLQDNLHVGDVNLVFRAIELEHMLWRIGAGINWFDSRSVSDAGLNATVKVDYFPVQPIILSGEVDYGRVGDAEMFHGSVSVGVILNRFEVFSGYDYRKIGPVKLEGPLFGLRVWW